MLFAAILLRAYKEQNNFNNEEASEFLSKVMHNKGHDYFKKVNE